MNPFKQTMNYTAVCLCMLLVSCNSGRDAVVVKEPEVKKDSIPLDLVPVSTAMDIVLLKQLPPGFYLDSLFKTDNLLNHQTTLYYPVSETDPAFNRKLRLFIERYEEEFKPDERGDEFQSSVFDLWLVADEHAEGKRTFKFRMQGYYPGAAHYNYDSAVFSYKVN